MKIQRGDIFYIQARMTIGSVQTGNRSAIIVSNDAGNRASSTVEVVYLTTREKREMLVHVPISSAPKPSTALCEQITTVDVSQLGDYCGHVTKEEMEQLERAMRTSLMLGCEAPQTNEKISPLPENVRVVDSALLEAERDTYKNLYYELLDRLLKR